MADDRITRTELLLILVASAIPRVAGALWLPNVFGDAYAYTEQIYYMRRAILGGSFSVTNLFGFWLPLYQLVCALISAVAGSSFFVPKLVSAVCGAGVCVLVCLITIELTSVRWLSFAAAIVVSLNPYHILYSSAAMTDVPYAFVVLLCVFCCIRNRWIAASLCGLALCLMRVESWIVVLLIPLFQMASRRKFSPLIWIILLAGQAFWLFVSWKATGSVWKYFEIRNDYIVETLAANPLLETFSAARVALDLLNFVYTANPLVLIASLALAFGLLNLLLSNSFRHAGNCRERLREFLAAKHGVVALFFFSHLGFLLLAYVTNNQPVIWPRYGLVFLVMGLPLLAYVLLPWLSAGEKTRRAAAYIFSIIFGLQFSGQLVDATRITLKNDQHRVVAEFLREQKKLNGETRVYCEDGAIRVLSRIPLEEFRDQYNTPKSKSDVDVAAFVESLRENQVRFLVYKDLQGSHLKEIVAKITSQPANSGITLEAVIPKPRNQKEEAIVIYRVNGPALATSRRKRLGVID